jgi:hypothetical protein
LTRCGKEYFTINITADTRAEQVFLLDPAGNLVELHQLGACRCTRAESRTAVSSRGL